MNTTLKSIFLASALLLLPATAAAQSADHDAVHRVMQKMLHGFHTDDPALIFETFRRDGTVLGYAPARGEVITRTAEEWGASFDGVPASDEAQRRRSYEILDVTGDAAMVKLTLNYPSWDGLDYLALTRIDGQWMIISKSWSGRAP